MFAALAIGICLSEKSDPPVTLGKQIARQGARFFAIRSPNAEYKLLIRRLPLHRCPGERRDVHNFFFLIIFQQRQHPSQGRRADIIKKKKDFILGDQVIGVLYRRVRFILVILEHNGNLSPVDSATRVDHFEISFRTLYQVGSQRRRRPALHIRNSHQNLRPRRGRRWHSET